MRSMLGVSPTARPSVIDARLHPADVVTHDEEDVRLLLLSYRRSSRYNRCHADGEERRQGDRRAGPTSFSCLKKSGLYSWVPPVMGCPRQRSFGLRPVAIKRLRQRQKVRGRRIANTEEAPEEHLPGLLPHEYEAWASRDPSHRNTTTQEDAYKVAKSPNELQGRRLRPAHYSWQDLGPVSIAPSSISSAMPICGMRRDSATARLRCGARSLWRPRPVATG